MKRLTIRGILSHFKKNNQHLHVTAILRIAVAEALLNNLNGNS